MLARHGFGTGANVRYDGMEDGIAQDAGRMNRRLHMDTRMASNKRLVNLAPYEALCTAF